MPLNLRNRMFLTIRKLRRIRRVIFQQPSRVYDWLYVRNLPKRFLRRTIILAMIVGYSLFLVAIALYLGQRYGTSLVPAFVNLTSAGIGSVLGWIYSFVERFSLINPSELVTFLFAEAIFAINAFLIKIIFFRKSSHGPRLMIFGGPTQTNDDGTRILSVRVNNIYGDRAARGCQAQLAIEDLEERDTRGFQVDASKYIDTPVGKAIETDLKWKDGSRDATIRVGRYADLEVLKYVPAQNGTLAHFEVPSEKGWESLSASLNITKYYLNMRVFPLNGKRKRVTVSTRSGRSNDDWIVG